MPIMSKIDNNHVCEQHACNMYQFMFHFASSHWNLCIVRCNENHLSCWNTSLHENLTKRKVGAYFWGMFFCWNVSYTCIFCFNDRTGFWSIRLFVWIKRAVMLLVECGNQKICVHKGMHDNCSPKKTSKNPARDSLTFWSFDQLTNIYRYDLKFYQQFKLDLC